MWQSLHLFVVNQVLGKKRKCSSASDVMSYVLLCFYEPFVLYIYLYLFTFKRTGLQNVLLHCTHGCTAGYTGSLWYAVNKLSSVCFYDFKQDLWMFIDDKYLWIKPDCPWPFTVIQILSTVSHVSSVKCFITQIEHWSPISCQHTLETFSYQTMESIKRLSCVLKGTSSSSDLIYFAVLKLPFQKCQESTSTSKK